MIERNQYLNQSQLLNGKIESLANQGGGLINLDAGVYYLDESLVMRSGVALVGQGQLATSLRASPRLAGPVVTTINAYENYKKGVWLESEGMPVRFSLSNLTVDGSEAEMTETLGSGFGMWLYGKAFSLKEVEVTGCLQVGIMSVGPVRGGSETWRDQPEAIFDVRVSRCGGDGFVMRGPHDSIIRSAIISNCKGRGLAVESDGTTYNGACDIEYCHAYGTEDVAIDVLAKVKAGFLQGDTGRGSGVRICGSQMIFVDRVEVFKTRGSTDSYAVQISAPYAQVGICRVRADWGTSGVYIGARGVQISSLDVEGLRNKGGPVENTPNPGVGLRVGSVNAQISACHIRNFDKGYGAIVKGGGNYLRGVYENCGKNEVRPDAGNEVKLKAASFE